MAEVEPEDEQPDPTRSKVGRLIDEHGLEELGDELEALWTAEGTERRSLRDLADYFNRELLRARLLEAGESAPDPEVEMLYELLTGEGASSGARARKRRELERAGIDPDELETDFVTHQAVHTYLTEFRGAEYQGEQGVDRAIETLQRLRGRTSAVTESTIDRLADAGRLDAARYEVFVDVRVLCQECGREHTVDDLLEEGGCGCADA